MAYFAKDLAMSRGRVLLIDGSAILGGLVVRCRIGYGGRLGIRRSGTSGSVLGITVGSRFGNLLDAKFRFARPRCIMV